MASASQPTPTDRPTLADRVAAARRDRFVGRSAERDRFLHALRATDPPFAVLFVHGPGGIGKSTLLSEYRRIATDSGRLVVAIDGRSCEPSPIGLLQAISDEMNLSGPEQVPKAMCAQNNLVLLVDTYEILQPLDDWLRNDFLPGLPASALTVIAGRLPPDARWRTSPGWSDLVEVQALRNLEPTESREYLTRLGIHEVFHPPAVAFTHGHPLALSLVGDVATRDSVPFQPERNPDVVTSLLEHFIDSVPSPAHRRALDVCAHARVTTESLLERVFGEVDADVLFDWLYGLSFIEHDEEGVFPHDLAREILVANLRWRHPERFTEMHRQVHDHVVVRVRSTNGRERFRELYNLMFLHRNNPTWQSFAPMEHQGREFFDSASPADTPTILEMIERHEGPRSADIAEQWLQSQPEGFALLRGIHGEISGVIVSIALQDYSHSKIAFDPVATAALDMFERHGPLRPEEEAYCVRFCMGRNQYRTPTLRLSFSMSSAAMVYTNPRLAWMCMPVLDPEFWEPVFRYVHINRYSDADLTIGSGTWRMFAHDWRQEPIEVLDRILTEREISLSPVLEPVASAPALMVLPEADFRQAVRQALRDFHRTDALATNPLIHSRLVAQYDATDAVSALRALLREAANQLDVGPRTRKYHVALHHTWFEPARTQEEAAELLDLPFSTYRRHLATGIEHVTGELWRRELIAATNRIGDAKN